MADVREQALTIDGIETVALEAGPPGAARAAVFVHGNPGSSEDWRALLGRTGDHGRALALDMPGFGRAGRPDDFAYDLPAYGAWLDAALRHLGVEQADLVLHDFGGGFGIAFAQRRPEAAASFVIMNAGPLPGYQWHSIARLWRRRGVGEALQAITTPKLLARGIVRDNPRLPRADADRMGTQYDSGTKRAVLKLYRACDPVPADDPGYAAVRALDRPGLVLWGAKDPYITPDWAQRAADAIAPSARVVVLPDAGHWPFLDEPDRAAVEIVPFLAELV